MALIPGLTALLLSLAVPIEHPSPDGFAPHVADTLRQAQATFHSARPPGGSDFGALAMVYHAHDLLEPAQQAYHAAHELAPGDARWIYFLALIDAVEGRFEQAATRFEQSLALNPDYQPAAVRLAQTQVRLGRIEAAMALLEPLVAGAPGLAAAHAELGLLYQTTGRPEQAVSQLEAALAAQPEATRLHAALGLAYRNAGRTAEARRQFALAGDREVVLHDPLEQSMRALSRSFNYFLNLGVNAAENGDLDGALAYLAQARRIEPDNANVLVTMARVYEASGDLEAAVAVAERALQVRPDYALAREQRGVLYEIAGDDEAALASYDIALGLDPLLADARLLLANGLMRRGSHAEAIAHLEKIQHLRAGSQVALKLAAARYESGDCAGAAEVLDGRLRQQASTDLLLALGRIVATCGAVRDNVADRVRHTLRQLYRRQQELAMGTTLAMLEMSAGRQDAAVELQSAALAKAQDGSSPDAVLQMMREQLAQYEAGIAPQRPWREDHPLAKPPRLRAGER